MFTPSLCETFRSLAHQTFTLLGRARTVGHQPGEETLTDLNMIELKTRHPDEILCETFNHHQERRNGADWEWWITNHDGTCWLGLLVQAKVLNLKKNSFLQLHYITDKKRKIPQLRILKNAAAKGGLTPMYCLFSHVDTSDDWWQWFGVPELFGCAMTHLEPIEKLKSHGELCDLDSVLRSALPWHSLVCHQDSQDGDLPNRAWALLSAHANAYAQRPTRHRSPAKRISPGPRSDPPMHVRALWENRSPDIVPENLAGVLIVREGSSPEKITPKER